MAQLDKHLQKAFDEIAAEVLADFERITESWTHQPPFTVEVGPDAIRIFTDDEIFAWVNDGTAPHVITAVNARNLAFAQNKIPKTIPGVIGSGPGAASGLVFRKSVFNPGAKARRFDLAIYEKWADKVADILEAQVIEPMVNEFEAEINQMLASGFLPTLPV